MYLSPIEGFAGSEVLNPTIDLTGSTLLPPVPIIWSLNAATEKFLVDLSSLLEPNSKSPS